MSGLNDALWFLDLDKSREPSPEEQARLGADRRLHAAWSRYQALRALALESAPKPTPKMLRAILSQCRREQVGRRLSEITGGDFLARELLLGGLPKSKGAGPWILGGLLIGALGLGWMVFRDDWTALLPGVHGKPSATNALGALLGRQDPVPFEFPVQSPPAEEALSGPGDGPSTTDADDVHSEAPAARQASRLLREHLHEAQTREQDPDDDEAVPAPQNKTDAVDSDADSIPSAEASPHFTGPKNAVSPATAVQTNSIASGRSLTTQAVALSPGMTLSSDSLVASADAASGILGSCPESPANTSAVDIAVTLPERGDIDVRLFNPAGRSTRTLTAGAAGPGVLHFSLEAVDDQGRILAPGTYYLRVMTPWFSRVEPIQIH